MNSKSIRYIIIAALAALAVAACKKDEETESLPSLTGRVTITAEPFVLKGGELPVTLSKLPEHPEGKGIGVYLKLSSEETSDTLKKENDPALALPVDHIFTFPDELGTYTITGTAFASGYYSTNTSIYVTTVDPVESLIGMGFSETDRTVTDPRDGKEYRITTIGNLDWFRENLAWKGSGENPVGLPYANAEAMTDVFGRYYTWSEAAGVASDGESAGEPACPEGWRLPTEDDWLDLGRALASESEGSEFEAGSGMEGIAGKMMVEACFNSEDNEMWEYWPDVKITNSSGLSVIPCGFANVSESTGGPVGNFDTAYLYAAFWTATESLENPDQAYFRYIYWDADVLQSGLGAKESFAATVRCVRDSE